MTTNDFGMLMFPE